MKVQICFRSIGDKLLFCTYFKDDGHQTEYDRYVVKVISLPRYA